MAYMSMVEVRISIDGSEGSLSDLTLGKARRKDCPKSFLLQPSAVI